jgi:hypothetical protein
VVAFLSSSIIDDTLNFSVELGRLIWLGRSFFQDSGADVFLETPKENSVVNSVDTLQHYFVSLSLVDTAV